MSTRPQSPSVRLYLELLKANLTRIGFGDRHRFVDAAELQQRCPPEVSQWIAQSGLRLVEEKPFNPELRESGHDWPSEAETMVGMYRLDNIASCIRDIVENQVPGDLIETGVWRGGVCIFMRAVLAAYGETGRTVWVADSFQGLPKPDAENYPSDDPNSPWGQLWRSSQLAVPLNVVKENFARYGLLDSQVRFLPGWFRDTLPTAPIEQIALLRLDGDLYESTIVALRSLYGKIAPGGYVLVDDYGGIPACKQAVDDFRQEHGIHDPLQKIDWTGVFWKVTRETEGRPASFVGIAPGTGAVAGEGASREPSQPRAGSRSRKAEPRVVVACSAESGSTYVARVLAYYLDVPFTNPLGFCGYQEQNLHPSHFTEALPSGFVLQMYLKPHPPHIDLIQKNGVKVVCFWRNLGDAVVAFDDHLLMQHWANPVCYIPNPADYAAQPRDARHRFLLQHGLPWLVSFYLSWKQVGIPEWLAWGSYEQMIEDRFAFFSNLIRGLQFEYDPETLKRVLETSIDARRFQGGSTERADAQLSESNKVLLERMLIEHPQDVSELLHELPWWPSRRGCTEAAVRYDGGMIRAHGHMPGDEMVYLVRDGKRRWITSPAWMEQQGRRWEEVRFISREELDTIPLGPPLNASPR